MPTDAELKVIARVKDLLREALELRGFRLTDVVHYYLLKDALAKRHRNLSLGSLVILAADLGYEVVIHFREAPSAQPVQKEK